MIDFFNELLQSRALDIGNPVAIPHTDPTDIKWTDVLQDEFRKGRRQCFREDATAMSSYRPFAKEWLYYDKVLNQRRYQIPKLFPTVHTPNLVISATGVGISRPFACLMTSLIPNLHYTDSGQVFPLYYYEPVGGHQGSLEAEGRPEIDGYVRHDAINDATRDRFQEVYTDPYIDKEDIFYYVYGVLHSPEYRTRFANDLKKMLPRIPYTRDFWAFSRSGRALGELHLGYENNEPWPLTENRTGAMFTQAGEAPDECELYRVKKMKFAKSGGRPDKSTVIYNDFVTVTGIPLDAYDYVVNGKPAIEWIMDRYQWSQDKESRIVNDPNEWSDDPRYIIDLLARLVRVSIETNAIVSGLPGLEEREAS